jgi:MraZ protein
MDRFIGNIDAKTDVKGRVFVPASFRKILQSSGNLQLILRKDIYQDCLVLYPSAVWNEELDQLRAKLNKWDERQQQVFRQFVLESEVLDMDANGRILIPKRYLQMAHIGGEIRFVGMDNTIEIWNRSKLDKPLIDADEFKVEIREFLIS